MLREISWWWKLMNTRICYLACYLTRAWFVPERIQLAIESLSIDGPFQSVFSSRGSIFEQNIIGPSFWYGFSIYINCRICIFAATNITNLWIWIQGVFICVLGLGLLVCSDELTKKDYEALSRGKGDALMVAGATLYGFSKYYFTYPFACISYFALYS